MLVGPGGALDEHFNVSAERLCLRQHHGVSCRPWDLSLLLREDLVLSAGDF